MKKLPESIKNAMVLYRLGATPIPEDYIRYHIAEALQDSMIKEVDGIFKILSHKVVDDGWMDGMKVLELDVIDSETRNRITIRWHDEQGGGSWFVKGAGWTRKWNQSKETN